eukprot:TRINITY_DN9243_c0_g1_i1.p1 TRINITY_DN9243_c0_g1~~TRINITY_DN9243_c0_g1_i1.p1  ORF type:complete len:379 (+),score=58.23 TRINITY_DN9243_c0_g1_i1:50-1186(+)
MAYASVEDALAVFARGDMLLVVDSANRKDEVDLIFPAEHMTTERMAFAVRHSTGIIYVAGSKDRFEHFGLHPATESNSERFTIGAYVSTTYLPGSTTGRTAADRAATARALCNLANPPQAFSKPGHMFPVVANEDGVLGRPGHTEAAYDLCRLSGRAPVACLTELIHEDGTMLRRDDALEFGKRHGLLIITVEQLIEYRQAHKLRGLEGEAVDLKSPSIRGLELPSLDGRGLRIGIVSARWNQAVCSNLVDGARTALASCNVDDVTVEYVAGSYEVPAAAQQLLETGRFDGIICIGCLIKEGAPHYEYVNTAVTQGIMRLTLDYKKPVIYGVLSCLNEAQARERSGLDGKGHNIGKNWGITCVESCLLRHRYAPKSRM